jgi:rare lipoprotein A
MLNILSIGKSFIAVALLSSFFGLCLNGCSSGRYQQANDSHPERLPSASELKNAVPKAEKKSRGGNKKTYQVWGKNYHVLDHAEGFSETGTASWYGKKFHGHLTSNGEIYNMYGMSAAHKNLPLPTYVKVTNVDNNKFVIVRVNDRGPFHQDRIIDLSYSAAYKLDMLATGTASVKITAITDIEKFNKHNKNNLAKQLTSSASANEAKQANSNAQTTSVPLSMNNKKSIITPSNNLSTPQDKHLGNHIQVFATTDPELAQNTALALSSLFQQPVTYLETQGIYRIQMGPMSSNAEIETILERLKASGYENAYRRSL